MSDELGSIFSYIGAAVILIWLLKFVGYMLNGLYSSIKTILKLHFNWKQLGNWALITGSSDGIGKSYAEELAKRGFNIILVSRSLNKLNMVAAEIKQKYSVKTEVLNVNFAEDADAYNKVEKAFRNFEVSVLVNNVGMSYPYAEYFHQIPDGMETIYKLIQMNITTATIMTKLFLPQMIKRKKGVIINISSLSALYPLPLLNVYCAAKAYVNFFSQALFEEYKEYNIVIQSVLPGYVATNMSKRKTNLQVPTSDVFVQSAIKTVGVESFTFGYLSHKISGWIHLWLKANMPDAFNMWLSFYIMSKARKRYFLKHNKICTES